jgi:hypothetical protein
MVQLFNSYLKSYKTRKRIIIIESDDWGATRMPSLDVYKVLSDRNIDVNSNPFNKFDCIETNQDLDILSNFLSRIREKTEKKVKFTLNYILANPDYYKIKEHNYEHYFYENFFETYQRFNESNLVLDKVKLGIKNGYFKPQFHGREHVNVRFWLNELRNKNQDLLTAFNYGTFALSLKQKVNIWESYNYRNTDDLNFIHQSISDGLLLFEEFFNYKSLSTIAPVGVWDDQIENLFYSNDIKIIQSFLNQKIPIDNSYINKYHFTGQLNKFRQIYTVRNCYFEPSTNVNINWVDKCMKQIELAFLFNNPAIISSHRINYVGGISESLRDNNLALFEKLIFKIVYKWPNVEFLFTDDFSNELIS